MNRRTAVYVGLMLIGFLAVMLTRPRTPDRVDLAQYGIAHALDEAAR